MACCFFYGDDLYSLREKVDFWKTEFIKKHGGDMNLEILDGATLVPADFKSAISTIPFLGEKRLVIVKNLILGNKKKQAEDDEEKSPETLKIISGMLDDVPDFCVVVFVEEGMPDMRLSLTKKLLKCEKVQDYKMKTGTAVIERIFKFCKDLGAEIEEEAAIYLSELTGGDLYRAQNEIHKLAHYAVSRPITKKDIGLLVNTQLDTSIFQLTDALGNGNAKKSLDILRRLLESGEEIHHIFAMVIRQFRIIIQTKELSSQNMRKAGIAAKIGEKPYPVSIAMAQAHNFSFGKLKTIYSALLAIDTKLKTGGIRTLAGDQREFELALDTFIVDACRKQA